MCTHVTIIVTGEEVMDSGGDDQGDTGQVGGVEIMSIAYAQV